MSDLRVSCGLTMCCAVALCVAVAVMGALGTCDPGDILQTLKSLKKNQIRCSVISLSAEVYVCKLLAQMTGGVCAATKSRFANLHVVSCGLAGTCNTALNREHLQRLLNQHVPPTPVPVSGQPLAVTTAC